MRKLLFVSAFAFCGACIAGNPAVTNQSLAAAIANIGSSPSIEARDDLYRELNRATYLVPLARDTANEGARFVPVVITSPKGERLQVIFSGDQELADSGLENGTVVQMHASELWKLIKENDSIDGAVLNPAKNAIPLSKARIDQILKHR